MNKKEMHDIVSIKNECTRRAFMWVQDERGIVKDKHEPRKSGEEKKRANERTKRIKREEKMYIPFCYCSVDLETRANETTSKTGQL